eukprot:11210528-Lingulodinium_polyedra.AAC.1
MHASWPTLPATPRGTLFNCGLEFGIGDVSGGVSSSTLADAPIHIGGNHPARVRLACAPLQPPPVLPSRQCW